MPKVICINSHEQPSLTPGKFKQYEVGAEYDLSIYDSKFFKIIRPVSKDKKKLNGGKDAD